jgi:uncharacterized protein (TIGR00299 family) protein
MADEAGVWIHLDPLGGIAGDMFVAALLDARPGLEEELAMAIARAGLPDGVRIARTAGGEHALTGSRVAVTVPPDAPASGAFSAIAARIEGTPLAAPVRARALDIYHRLAEAEAQVHGVPAAEVRFHELADWDSYADILAAAWLIERLAPRGWSCGALPLGGGRIRSAHGRLPVPAPATALLLRGFDVVDDGIEGERVTPTGAAILAHLRPARHCAAGRLVAVGNGFGTRRLAGVPNVLRALLLADAGDAAAERIAVIRFEVDDQSPEDLAIGLDRIRAVAGVRDVCQWPVLGKKGRLAAAVQVLCEPALVESAAEACLSETATLGLRLRVEERRVLSREELTRGGLPIKRARRPDGALTAKLASDVAAEAGAYAARARLRRRAEEDGA